MWPAWTDLVRNPRNGVNLLPQDPRLRVVLRAANSVIKRNSALVHPYPEIDDKQDYLITTLHAHAAASAPEVAARMTADRRYAELLGTIVSSLCSLFDWY